MNKVVIDALSGIVKPMQKITPESRIQEDLNLDSLDLAEFGVEIECKMGWSDNTILVEDVMEARTVADLIKLMEKYAKRRMNGVKSNDVKPEQRFVKGHFTAAKRKIAVHARMSKTK